MESTAQSPRDAATERLITQLTDITADKDELYRTLLNKLTYLTNGSVLSGGGLDVLEQVKLFSVNQPQVRVLLAAYI